MESVFLLTIPPPPRSTLFPYTTLFRSGVEYDPNRTARIALLHYADGEKRYIVAPKGLAVGDTVDRKSTRLNSSHVAISYAVFCLKKKKRKEDSRAQLNDQS